MTENTRKVFNLAKDYVMITFGLLCYAFGFTAFILPEKIVNKVGISRCRVYVSCTNLFTVTGYSGYDPEVGGGVDYGNYPQSRTVQMGLNLNF